MLLSFLAPLAFADVTSEAPAPDPARNIDLGGLRGGYGMLPTPGHLFHGPSFGLSYSFHSRHLALTFQPIEVGWGTSEEEESSAFGLKFLRFEGAYLFTPERDVSFYTGGGLGFGLVLLHDGVVDPGGGGVELPVFFGAEILRSGNLRFYSELEGIVPLYRLEGADDTPAGWPVSVGLRLGVSVRMRRSLADVVAAWID